jgi:hypothetical protein
MCLSEFIDWKYSQSCWHFRPSIVNYCPSNHLSGSPSLPPLPSPLPCVKKYTIYSIQYTVYTYTVCKGEYGVLGLRQINTCREVPLQVNIFRWRHFALPSVSLIFLRHLGSDVILCRVCGVFLIDSHFMVDGGKFISGAMAALSVMVNLEIPHVNILSKVTILKGLRSVRKMLRVRYIF